MKGIIMDKSEAQLRNAEEVARILRERGYETASESNPKKPRRDYKRIKQIAAIVAVLSICVFGFFMGSFLINHSTNGEKDNGDEITNGTSEPANNYSKLTTCLDAAYTDVQAGDEQFYPKLIASYKAQLDCYGRYPMPGNSDKVESVKQQLANVEIAAKDAGVSQANIDAAYNSANTTLQQRLAEIDAEAAAHDEETERKLKQYDEERAKRNAEYEKQAAERAAKATACNNFTTQYPNVDAYRNKNGNIDELWDTYQAAKTDYESFTRAAYNPNATYSDKVKADIETTLDMKKAARDSAYSAYKTAYDSLSQQYNSEYNSACL